MELPDAPDHYPCNCPDLDYARDRITKLEADLAASEVARVRKTAECAVTQAKLDKAIRLLRGRAARLAFQHGVIPDDATPEQLRMLASDLVVERARAQRAIILLAEARAQAECDDTDYDGPAYDRWLWLRGKADEIRDEAKRRVAERKGTVR